MKRIPAEIQCLKCEGTAIFIRQTALQAGLFTCLRCSNLRNVFFNADNREERYQKKERSAVSYAD